MQLSTSLSLLSSFNMLLFKISIIFSLSRVVLVLVSSKSFSYLLGHLGDAIFIFGPKKLRFQSSTWIRFCDQQVSRSFGFAVAESKLFLSRSIFIHLSCLWLACHAVLARFRELVRNLKILRDSCQWVIEISISQFKCWVILKHKWLKLQDLNLVRKLSFPDQIKIFSWSW